MKDDCSKPIYTTTDSVKVRLANKVQFQSGDQPVAGELPDQLLAQLIADAETSVEQDLRGRYAIPFQSKTTGTWAALPDHSRRAIRRACDLMAVIEVMRTDFGRGTAVEGEFYLKTDLDAYSSFIKKLLGQDQEGKSSQHSGRFRFTPPLDELLLAKSNREADDGYKGMIINTDDSCNGAEDYAKRQINNPSQSYVDPLLTRRGR